MTPSGHLARCQIGYVQRGPAYRGALGSQDLDSGLVYSPVYMLAIYLDVAGKDPLEGCAGFEWDEYNVEKNWERHRVRPEEAEEIFLQEPLVVRSDLKRQGSERRYYALGQTSDGRFLFAAFTIRRKLIRIISVRDMNRNEAEAFRIHERAT